MLDILISKLSEYSKFNNITVDSEIYFDLDIYGDDFEDLLFDLSEELMFNIETFSKEFDYKSLMRPEMNIDKIYYLELLCMISKLFTSQTTCNKLVMEKRKQYKSFTVQRLLNLIDSIKGN